MTPLFGGGDKGDQRPRTAAERERDRLERERRRAAREGRPLPEAPAPEETAAAPEPEPRREPQRAPEPEEQEPEPRHDEPPLDAPLTWDEPEPAVTVLGRSERPIGTKRVKASPVASAAGADGPPRFGAPPRGVPRSRRGLRRVVPVLGLALIVAVAWFAWSLFQPFKGDGSGRVVVRIPAGAGAGDIGDLLASKDVVSSSFFFSLRARLSGDRGKLRSGTYALRKDMSYAAAIDALTTPPAAAKTVEVAIPEGLTARAIASLAHRAGLRGSYLKATRDRDLLSPRDYGAPKGTKTLEGFLFPATYQLRAGAPARTLAADQVKAFKAAFAKVDLKRAKRKNLTAYDVITIASMIEGEAAVDKDRRLISAVIYNRLKKRMPLGIDATIRYRLNTRRPLTVSQLNSPSAYNTRVHTGLPPTPIGNPGLKSLRAAANPAKVGYLYYVVKPCGDGAHAFSSTEAKFQRDVDAYNAARAKRGGKDPSRC